MNQRPSSYERDDLLACARGDLFGVGNAQLPNPPMLMIDRITHISETGGTYDKGEIIAEFDVKPDNWFFGCHFVGDPVMPGCLGLDALWQITGFFLGWKGSLGRGRALGVENVKFTGMVTPKIQKIEYRVSIKRVITRKATLAIADGLMNADGELIYTTKNMRVGVFQDD